MKKNKVIDLTKEIIEFGRNGLFEDKIFRYPKETIFLVTNKQYETIQRFTRGLTGFKQGMLFYQDYGKTYFFILRNENGQL